MIPLKRHAVAGILILIIPIWSHGYPELADSVKKVGSFIITPRINSAGHFPFTGSLLNHNVNADLNLFFERKALGFFIFKSHDLKEKNSIVNYLQPGLFATLKLNSSLKARVFLGYIFSQAYSFRDADSDYYSAVSLYWDITKDLRVENTTLFYDLNQKMKVAERLLFSWRMKNAKIELYLWERIILGEQNYATSAMLSFTFPTLKISESVSIFFTSSYQRYLTENKPNFALTDGFLFSITMPVIFGQ